MVAAAAPAVKPTPNLVPVRGVEIFEAGTFRDKAYTVQDLDHMVANFSELKSLLRPPVVVGHEEDQSFLENSGYPAAGHVESVWREGNTLMADFADVPATIARLIDGRAYSTVSAEVYDDFEYGGKSYGKALRRVALLGGELPQIKTLADLPLSDYAEAAARLTPLLLRPRVPTRIRTRSVGPRSPAGTYQVFAEVVVVDRKQLEEQAAKLGLSPETVKMLQDDVLAKVVMDLMTAEQGEPDVGGAAPPATPPATSVNAEPPPPPPAGTAPPPGMSREEMIAALVQAGQDPTALQQMSDEQVAQAYQQLQTQPAAPPATPPAAGAMGDNRLPAKVIMQYSEQQLEHVVGRLVNAAVARMQAPLATAVQRLDRFAEERIAAEKRATVTARLDTLVQQGKVLPAERDGGLDEVAFALDAKTVRKFSEGGKTVDRTPFDHFFAVLERRPTLVRFGERIKTGRAGTAGGGTDDELAKVQAYAQDERFAGALRAAGKTPEGFVAKFSEAKKKMPALTAEQYGVPAVA